MSMPKEQIIDAISDVCGFRNKVEEVVMAVTYPDPDDREYTSSNFAGCREITSVKYDGWTCVVHFKVWHCEMGREVNRQEQFCVGVTDNTLCQDIPD